MQASRRGTGRKGWRRGSESNRRIKVLQTSPLPLGYRAPAAYVSVPSGKSPPAGSILEAKFWSGRRDLNPRLRPWQGRTLPLSYSRSLSHFTALVHFPTIHCTASQPVVRHASFFVGHSTAVRALDVIGRPLPQADHFRRARASPPHDLTASARFWIASACPAERELSRCIH